MASPRNRRNERPPAPPPPKPIPLGRHLTAFSVLTLAITLVYLPSLRGEFQFDDAMGIERGGWLLPKGHEAGTLLRTLSGWSGRGLVTATYQLNYWIAGGDEQHSRSINAGGDAGNTTLPFHLFNVLTHLQAAGALYVLLALMTLRLGRPSTLVPALGAACFALHPLATESVSYISARSGTMAACYGFWGIAGLLAFGTRGADGAPPSLRSRALAAFLLGLGAWLAVGCKETGWMIPLMGMSALAWCYLGDWRALWKDWGSGLLAGGSVFALGMGIWISERGLLSDGFLRQYANAYQLPPSDALVCHVATQLHIWWTTHLPRLLLPFGPWHSSVDLNPPLLNNLDGAALALASGEALATLLALGWAWRRRRILAALGLAWIALSVLPVSFAAMQDATTERHTYMPLAGAALLAAGAAEALVSRRRALRMGIVAALAILCCLTAARTAQWKSEHTLWGGAIRDAPQKARPHYNMAKAMVRQAIESMRSDPERSRDLGLRAEKGLRLCLRAAPTFHLAHGALARELERQERLPEAAAEYHLAVRYHAAALSTGEAVEMHTGQITALTYTLARCLHRLGKDAEAADEFNWAIAYHVQSLQNEGPSKLHAQSAVDLISLLAAFHREGGRMAQARQTVRDGLALFRDCPPLQKLQRSLEEPPAPAPGEKH